MVPNVLPGWGTSAVVFVFLESTRKKYIVVLSCSEAAKMSWEMELVFIQTL